MTRPKPGVTATGEQPGPRHAHGRRGDSGLTTLEWLLIVAAVAGLAALAVVLVQRVVGDTSEQIGGQSARETAAKVAATRITDSATADGLVTGAVESTINTKYQRECNRLRVLYSDAGITTTYTPGVLGTGSWTNEPVCVASATGGTILTAPGAPTGVAYDPTTGVLTWTAPPGTGITYNISCTGPACPTAFTSVTGHSGTTITVGLPGSTTAGDAALFEVTATNSGGTGPAGTDTHTV